MRVRGIFLIAAISLVLAACGGSGDNGTDPNDGSNNDADSGDDSGSVDDGAGSSTGTLGLDGTWAGIAEDINLNMASYATNIEGASLTGTTIDGKATGETGTINQLQSDVFEYLTSFDVYGGFMTDPTKSYAVVVNELWDFAVVQKGASAPFGTASITDLDGTWTGSVIGFFENTTYRYPTTAECGSGICVFTVTGPIVDENGSVVENFTGVQSTWGLSHRVSLAFDANWQNTLGTSGFGAGFLSKDEQFFGVYGCLPSAIIEDCEFGALVKQ